MQAASLLFVVCRIVLVEVLHHREACLHCRQAFRSFAPMQMGSR